MRLIETEIRELKLKMLDMADLVGLQLDFLQEALITHDDALMKRIKRHEKKIDKYDTKIDRRCERIIALHQPVADDLRFIFSAIKINSFLEQIGDIANGIARKISETHWPIEPAVYEALELQQMAKLTRCIVSEALYAFFKENAEMAHTVFAHDDSIDTINRRAFERVVEMIQKDPQKTDDYIQLLLIIKSLEKIADFAVNIAEESIYHLEGVIYKHTDLKHAHRNTGKVPDTANQEDDVADGDEL
jgi:phosphate transport system protein